MKKGVFELTECCLEESATLEDVDIGYVGRSNNKRLIETDKDVEEGYSNRFDHKHDGLVLYIEEKKKKRQAHKRKFSTSRNGRWITSVNLNYCY